MERARAYRRVLCLATALVGGQARASISRREQAHQRRVPRPGRRQGELLGPLRRDRSREVPDGLQPTEHVEPRGGLGSAEVVGAEAHREHEGEHAIREVPDVGGRARPVGEPVDLLPIGETSGARGEEVLARAEHLTRAHHEVLGRERPHEGLAGELAPPVHAQRVRRVELVVRAPLLAVEHVVGRDVEQHGAARPRPQRQALRRERVVPVGALRLDLARVDPSEGREVEHDVGSERDDGPHHRVVIADVELGVVEGDDIVVRGHDVQERPSEPAAGAGDEQPHLVVAGVAASTSAT
jgi:hypothetical protein